MAKNKGRDRGRAAKPRAKATRTRPANPGPIAALSREEALRVRRYVERRLDEAAHDARASAKRGDKLPLAEFEKYLPTLRAGLAEGGTAAAVAVAAYDALSAGSRVALIDTGLAVHKPDIEELDWLRRWLAGKDEAKRKQTSKAGKAETLC